MPVALRRITPAVVQSIQVFFQVVLYAGLFIFAQYLVSWLHLPLPANLVGMILMLALIVCRILPLQWVRAGARWLLAEMLLFFVPAVVAVVNYAQLLLVDGWRDCLPCQMRSSVAWRCVRSLRHLLWQRASRSADSLIWWRCLWWSPVCLAWRLATCCFYVSLFAKGWRKVLDSARHLMVPGLRGRMNWVNKKA